MWPFGKTEITVEAPKNDVNVSNVVQAPAVALYYREGDILIFEHPDKLSDSCFERLKTQLDSMFGASKNKRALVLENGMKLTTVLNK
jgi:hypothetical protein